MQFEFHSQASHLRRSAHFQKLKRELLECINEASEKTRGIRPSPSSSEVADSYQKLLNEFGKKRGRELYFPFLASGLGCGPFVELVDGSVKYDMITGIGVNFFGHSHPAFVEEMIDGLPSDVMQGNLQPGLEVKELLDLLLPLVGKDCRLSHGWLMCSGTMVNEIALKIIRQKKFPASRIFAFEDCFAGRSTAMQEITDNPGYRQGQPTYGEVHYLPFYEPKIGLEASVQRTLEAMKSELKRYPDRFAALMIELIQGEGGVRFAPREYYVRIFEEAKKNNLAIWVDEIQTFGRTGELFAYQKFSLNEYVDVVTIGKMLQACMVLFAEEYNPKPGLVAGTFSGSTAAIKTGRRVLELLLKENFLGPQGKIEALSRRFAEKMNQFSIGSCKGWITETRIIGGMIAFTPFSGSMDDIKAILKRLFDLGVIAFYCGHGPYLIRMLPPLGVMTESDVDQVCGLIEKALIEESQKRKIG